MRVRIQLTLRLSSETDVSNKNFLYGQRGDDTASSKVSKIYSCDKLSKSGNNDKGEIKDSVVLQLESSSLSARHTCGHSSLACIWSSSYLAYSKSYLSRQPYGFSGSEFSYRTNIYYHSDRLSGRSSSSSSSYDSSYKALIEYLSS